MFGGPQKAAKVMTGSQSVVPEELYHRAAQGDQMGYRSEPAGALTRSYSKGYGKNFRILIMVEMEPATGTTTVARATVSSV